MNRRKLKLLIVIIDLSGGTGVYCRNLSLGLRRYFPHEFDVSLLTMRNVGILPSDAGVFDSLQTLAMPVSSPMQIVRVAAALRTAIDHTNPDVILAVHTFANLIVPMVAPRRRILLTVHGHLSTILQEARHPFILKTLLRWRLPQRPIVAPSRELADDLIDNFHANDLMVIPHGIDIDAVRSAGESTPADLPRDPYIIATGRLAPQKDYPTLLRAYAAAVQAGIPEHLVILGDGDALDELQRLAKSLNISNRVHFLGHRNPPFPYMSRARFFVLSSIWEGFGLGLVEAMALGVPCISTNCPAGPAEILNHGAEGILVPTKNPQALGDAIVRLSRDAELRRSLSARATRRAQDFSLHQMTLKYRELLHQLA